MMYEPILNWFRERLPAPRYTVVFYMKSGNVVRMRNVTKLNYKYNGDVITELSAEWKGHTGVLLTSLCLAQVEAIAKED